MGFVKLTKKELDSVRDFTKKILTLLNGVPYQRDLISLDKSFQSLNDKWNELITFHHTNLNHSMLSLFVSELIYHKNSDEYENESVLEFTCITNHGTIKALKHTAYDLFDFSNKLLLEMSPHKKRHGIAVNHLIQTLEQMQGEFNIFVPKEIHDDDFMSDATWLNLYDVAKYIHTNYLELASEIATIQDRIYE